MNDQPVSSLDKRRLFAKLGVSVALSPIWSKPLLNSVVLPAHAQTSWCSASELIGSWEIVSTGASGTTTGTYTLYNDGTGIAVSNNNSAISWLLSDNTFEITVPFASEKTIYRGTINQPCNSFSGEVIGFIPQPLSFTARKL